MSETDSNICKVTSDKVRLIFACSGGSDVGHLSDLAARKLTKDGCGKMFCLTGIGGKVAGILDTTEKADEILVIDGCPVDCAKKTVEQAGFDTFKHFRVTDLDFQKGESPATDASVYKIAVHGKGLFS